MSLGAIWFLVPDLNLVKNGVGTQLKPVQFKSNNLFLELSFVPSLDKAQKLLWIVYTTSKYACLARFKCCVIIFWVIFWSMLTPLLLVAEWWRISFRGRMKQSPVTQSIVSDAVSIQSWRNYAIAIIGETADEIHRYGVSSN